MTVPSLPSLPSCPSGFNGATANSPWMTEEGAVAADGGERRLNGAAANSPWMTKPKARRWALTTALQWGHGEFAVDDAGVLAKLKGLFKASMGPRRIRRG